MVLEERKNYYDILELTPDCHQDEINIAYQRARNSYCDESAALYSLLSTKDCQEILEQVEQAYSVLGDPLKRLEYNKVKNFSIPDSLKTFMSKHSGQSHEASVSTDLNLNKKNSDELQQLSQETINANLDYQKDALATSNSPINDLMDPLIYRQDHSQEQDQKGFKYTQAHSGRSEVAVSKIQAQQKFSLNFEPNYDFEQKIENTTEFNGNFLRAIRDYKNMTIERMADLTKISKTYLRHIEDENIEKLPAEVYTRGFVFQYAKILKLNPDLVATSYLKIIRDKKKGLDAH